MSRYNLTTGPEGEYEPGSGGKVLRNKLSIKDPDVMHKTEDVALQMVETEYLVSGPINTDTTITAEMIRRMHRDWLEDIYEWAGNYRFVDMSKGGFSFPPAWLIPRNMENFEQEALS